MTLEPINNFYSLFQCQNLSFLQLKSVFRYNLGEAAVVLLHAAGKPGLICNCNVGIMVHSIFGSGLSTQVLLHYFEP